MERTWPHSSSRITVGARRRLGPARSMTAGPCLKHTRLARPHGLILVLCRRDEHVFGHGTRHRRRRYTACRGVLARQPQLPRRCPRVGAGDGPSLERRPAESWLLPRGQRARRRRVPRPVLGATRRRTARGVLQPRRLVRAAGIPASRPATASRTPRPEGLPLHRSLAERQRPRAEPPAPFRLARYSDCARPEPPDPPAPRPRWSGATARRTRSTSRSGSPAGSWRSTRTMSARRPPITSSSSEAPRPVMSSSGATAGRTSALRLAHLRERSRAVPGGPRAAYRHLPLRHRIPFTLVELRVSGSRPRAAVMLRSPRPRMYRSPTLGPDQIDYLYSELARVAW